MRTFVDEPCADAIGVVRFVPRHRLHHPIIGIPRVLAGVVLVAARKKVTGIESAHFDISVVLMLTFGSVRIRTTFAWPPWSRRTPAASVRLGSVRRAPCSYSSMWILSAAGLCWDRDTWGLRGCRTRRIRRAPPASSPPPSLAALLPRLYSCSNRNFENQS